MLLLGIDIGTSSVKVSVVNSQSQEIVASAAFPETEAEIISVNPGWAEQSPNLWWEYVKQAILKCHAKGAYNPQHIGAIGIAYQMHGLVLIDKQQQVLRNAIIWCDSRAVEIGNKAFHNIGEEKCLSHLLNSPGNFTASKLAWVKVNEPSVYENIDKIMLPGDFIAMKFTGNCTTSISSLSEGVFWDFKNNELSKDIFSYYGFPVSFIPEIKNVFTEHGRLNAAVANSLSLQPSIPVTYKAGDQPNNALALNVLEAGEVAATAGTSGVIYGVSDALTYDEQSRINSFAHVNYTNTKKRIGVLLCINGTGILNRWVKNITAGSSYEAMNAAAQKIEAGSNGLLLYPFGNGAERIFENKIIGAGIENINLNLHTTAHIYKAAQEGIAFAFRYGLDIMKENKMQPAVIRAGKANMFLSNVFVKAFVNTLNIPVELHNSDGSVGAAIGAGIGAGVYSNAKEAFSNTAASAVIMPDASVNEYNNLYNNWKENLLKKLN